MLTLLGFLPWSLVLLHPDDLQSCVMLARLLDVALHLYLQYLAVCDRLCFSLVVAGHSSYGSLWFVADTYSFRQYFHLLPQTAWQAAG